MAGEDCIARLRDAIADVRSEFHGEQAAQDLLDLLDRAEEAAKEVSYNDTPSDKSKSKKAETLEPRSNQDEKDDAAEDRKDQGKDENTERPRDLRAAADETRRRFRSARDTRDRAALKRNG